MKICTKCKAESEDWQIYCKECGEKLPESETAPPTADSEEAQILKNREKQLIEQNGQQQGQINQLQEQNARLQEESYRWKASYLSKKKEKTIFLILMLVSFALFIMAVIGCFVFMIDAEYYTEKYYDYSQKYYDLDDAYSQIEPEYEFYHDYAVIVPDDDSGLYHRFGCEDCSRDSFWIYNTEAAQNKFEPCPKCID